MRIDRVYIKKFKNLVDFRIDLNENEMKTVLLGQNATGKSNFIEALVLVFKYLDLEREPPAELALRYCIDYICRGNRIRVEHLEDKYTFTVRPEPVDESEVGNDSLGQISNSEFFKNKDVYLPKYVFTYYSGVSNRLQNHFDDHQKRFYDRVKRSDFRDTQIDSLRRLFYVQAVHSHFVLLAYFYRPDKSTKNFLKDLLEIHDLESILFVLRKPRWNNPSGDQRFFGAEGLVRDFLSKLWELSLAPIYSDERVSVDFRSHTTQKRLYLFLKDKENLKKLADFFGSNTAFFKALESTYISDLIEEVRIRVRKRKTTDRITFRELSEGEQQLLTVLGLLKFTKDEESLILLDEPDTHLNPTWKWRYLELLDEVVQNERNTQILINTHDPLVIGGLKKEQVRIFESDAEGAIATNEPETDPRGLGVAGILTSDIFGLPTTLDRETQRLLDERNHLLYKQAEDSLTPDETRRIQDLFRKLNHLGFTNTFKDPYYSQFLIAMERSRGAKKPADQGQSSYDLEKQDEIAISILEEVFKKEKDDTHRSRSATPKRKMASKGKVTNRSAKVRKDKESKKGDHR